VTEAAAASGSCARLDAVGLVELDMTWQVQQLTSAHITDASSQADMATAAAATAPATDCRAKSTVPKLQQKPPSASRPAGGRASLAHLQKASKGSDEEANSTQPSMQVHDMGTVAAAATKGTLQQQQQSVVIAGPSSMSTDEQLATQNNPVFVNLSGDHIAAHPGIGDVSGRDCSSDVTQLTYATPRSGQLVPLLALSPPQLPPGYRTGVQALAAAAAAAAAVAETQAESLDIVSACGDEQDAEAESEVAGTTHSSDASSTEYKPGLDLEEDFERMMQAEEEGEDATWGFECDSASVGDDSSCSSSLIAAGRCELEEEEQVHEQESQAPWSPAGARAAAPAASTVSGGRNSADDNSSEDEELLLDTAVDLFQEDLFSIDLDAKAKVHRQG
jgi:hypothetical protein